MVPKNRLPAYYAASKSRRQRVPPELEEISSCDVVRSVLGGGALGPLPPTNDPDTNRDSEAREALSPRLSPNHTDPDIRRDLEGQASDGTGSPTEWLPEPVLV